MTSKLLTSLSNYVLGSDMRREFGYNKEFWRKIPNSEVKVTTISVLEKLCTAFRVYFPALMDYCGIYGIAEGKLDHVKAIMAGEAIRILMGYTLWTGIKRRLDEERKEELRSWEARAVKW